MNRPFIALLTALLLAGCSGGGGGGGGSKDHGTVTATGPAGAQVATVGMNDKLQFTPNVVVAKVGTLTLTIKNLGVVPHNLVYDTDGLGKTSSIAGGASQDLKTLFSKAGTYTFTCTFHPGMDGRVVVS